MLQASGSTGAAAGGGVQGYWTLPDGGTATDGHMMGNLEAATKMSSAATAQKSYAGKDAVLCICRFDELM